MWGHLPVESLTNWQPCPYTPPATPTGRLGSGGRVVLLKQGTVAYERSGFALVRWDDGTESLEWASELEEAA